MPFDPGPSNTDAADVDADLVSRIAAAAQPLPPLDDPGFAAFVDRFAGCRVVLLGEASHGTAEFYQARAAITRRLVAEHGFRIVAVEADWPDAAVLDRHVRHRAGPAPAEPPFQRFPTWMWRNTDVAAFVDWLREHNAAQPAEARAGFFGLDLYNLAGSISAVLAYLDQHDPDAADAARERYSCLARWQRDPAEYGRAAFGDRHGRCEEAVVEQLRTLLAQRRDYARSGGDDFLDAAQNARLVASAERYYREMYYGSAHSWNLRDTHMFETLEQLLAAHGEDARAVVWAHNSHIGDAAATEMSWERNELNLGQLCRQRHGEQAALIGFGTHAGTVAAAHNWDESMQVMQVRPSRADSVEQLAHATGIPSFVLHLRGTLDDMLREGLRQARLARYIGVIYRPETERYSHYAESRLADQYDAWVWFDRTQAVTPLRGDAAPGAPDTYPFGI